METRDEDRSPSGRKVSTTAQANRRGGNVHAAERRRAMTTIQARIERVYRALTLIVGASHETNDSPLDDSDVLHAIQETAGDIRDEMYWLRQTPESILQLPSPSDDDVEARFPDIKALSGEERSLKLEEGRQRIVSRGSSVSFGEAEATLRMLANALALAFRDDTKKRAALLELVATVRSELSLDPWTSPHVRNSGKLKTERRKNIGKPVVTTGGDDRPGA
jgi:hypothetical protein